MTDDERMLQERVADLELRLARLEAPGIEAETGASNSNPAGAVKRPLSRRAVIGAAAASAATAAVAMATRAMPVEAAVTNMQTDSTNNSGATTILSATTSFSAPVFEVTAPTDGAQLSTLQGDGGNRTTSTTGGVGVSGIGGQSAGPGGDGLYGQGGVSTGAATIGGRGVRAQGGNGGYGGPGALASGGVSSLAGAVHGTGLNATGGGSGALQGAGVRATGGVGVQAYGTVGVAAYLSGTSAAFQMAPIGSGAPTGGAHYVGEVLADGSGDIYYCTAGGSPGTWKKVASTADVAATPNRVFLLPAPVRVVNTFDGTGGHSGLLAANSVSTFGPFTSAGIPADAQGILGNVTPAGYAGQGFLTLWPFGASQPNASTVNFSDGGGTIFAWNNSFVCGLGRGQVNVFVSSTAATQLVIDVVGYIR